jgi:hypothetical protein
MLNDARSTAAKTDDYNPACLQDACAAIPKKLCLSMNETGRPTNVVF